MLKIRSVPAVVAGAFLLFGLVGWLGGLHLGMDSAVYRSGALAVLNGEALYGHLTATPDWWVDLPFTYPPIAAVLFLPLALLPIQLVWAVFAAGTALGVGAVLRWSTGRMPSLLLLALAFSLEPVWRTIGFGQINVVLMAMVVFDLLRANRCSGVLIGVAAAIKLTPLIFVLHLLVTGRVKEAGRAIATFCGLHLLGFLLLPGDSIRYWGSAMIGGNNATGNGYIFNQSFSGAVQRLTGGAAWAPVLVAVLSVCCVVVAAILARRTYLRGEHLAAALITAFCGLLVSPISWSHHWVWVVPLVALLVRKPGVLLVWVVFTWWSLFIPSGNALLDNLYVVAALAGGAIWWARGRSEGDVRSARTDAGALWGRWSG
ncbi:glycosyltransferase 87 family protein [Lentzea sp. BCCO 10_0856]|uniref:Glycosyltransferase 87 family protein n=1 Tax=Lentzea miocenica TaxID=3095431 RepID=A0ABU4ST34_9PSEU|nr:glycosyltransferase 87 family protein [Lentzea sp. BCCO 10_0856]MDX8029055.1 glycosyltransferase 87 family protein [Lentzea sp. BCCO 10_0856]